MPLYEYECEAGHRFELIRKFADPPVESCPECGRAVHKLMSSPAFQFKGTGWYVTDYARKNNSAPANGKSDGKKETRTETKSEAKSESKPSASASDK